MNIERNAKHCAAHTSDNGARSGLRQATTAKPRALIAEERACSCRPVIDNDGSTSAHEPHIVGGRSEAKE